MDRPTRLSNRVVWGLIALGLLLFFFVLPHGVDGDGRLRFVALQGWLTGHGTPDTKYPLIGSLPAVPLMLLGRVVASPDWWVSRYNVVVYAAGIGLLYALLRRRLAGDVLGAFLLLLGTTAMLPNSLKGFGAETFSAMAVGTGLVAWSVGRWKTATVLLGVGVANQPASFVGLALALGWWAWREKQLRALAPLVLSAGLWMLENAVRKGSAIFTGYAQDHGFRTLLPYSGLTGFSYPLFFGVPSLLLSFGKGLLFFTPGLVLAFGRGLEAVRPIKDVMVLWLLYLVGLVLVYGGWWAWYGGYTWGPRFLIVASLPASLLLAAQVRRRQARSCLPPSFSPPWCCRRGSGSMAKRSGSLARTFARRITTASRPSAGTYPSSACCGRRSSATRTSPGWFQSWSPTQRWWWHTWRGRCSVSGRSRGTVTWK